MEVIGTTPRMEDDSMEGGGREGREHLLEVEPRQEQRSRVESGHLYGYRW